MQRGARPHDRRGHGNRGALERTRVGAEAGGFVRAWATRQGKTESLPRRISRQLPQMSYLLYEVLLFVHLMILKIVDPVSRIQIENYSAT